MKITAAPVLPPLPEPDYQGLRESIRAAGVKVPLVVTQDGLHIDGHARLRAMGELGIRRVRIDVRQTRSESERRESAIVLNRKRRHLTRADVRALIIDQLKHDPARSDRYHADIIGVDHKTVTACRRELERRGEIPHRKFFLGKDGKRYRATSVMTDSPSQAAEASRLLKELGEDAPSGVASLRTLRTKKNEKTRADYAAQPEAALPAHIRIDRADFRRWEGIEDGTVDLIVTDPPWLGDYLHLTDPFAKFAARVLKRGGLLACYTGPYHIPEWLGALARHLKFVWPIACVNDSGGALMSAMQGRRIHNGWRPVFLFSKGEYRLPWLLKDVVRTEVREKDLHDWGQPLSESVYFVEKLSLHGATVCDPFVGSGTVAVAVAQVAGGRRFIGCDADAKCVRIARRRVMESPAMCEWLGQGQALKESRKG